MTKTIMKVVKSEELSKPFDMRYVCIDETSGKVLDDAQGYGYRSPEKAHAAFAFKHPSPEQKQERERRDKIISEFLSKDGNKKTIQNKIEDIWFVGFKDSCTEKEIKDELFEYLDTIGFDFKENGITKQIFLNYIKYNNKKDKYNKDK